MNEHKHNICETVTSIKVAECKLISCSHLTKFEVRLRAEGDILIIHCDGEFF
jgi:hypothetical protein